MVISNAEKPGGKSGALLKSRKFWYNFQKNIVRAVLCQHPVFDHVMALVIYPVIAPAV